MRKLFVNDLRVGMFISPDGDPGLKGFITEIEPTTDGLGSRIRLRLLVNRFARRLNALLLAWPDEYLQFELHDPREYGVEPPPATQDR